MFGDFAYQRVLDSSGRRIYSVVWLGRVIGMVFQTDDGQRWLHSLRLPDEIEYDTRDTAAEHLLVAFQKEARGRTA